MFPGWLIGPCVLDARLDFALYYCGVCIFELENSKKLCVFAHVQGLVGCVIFYRYIFSFVTLRGSSHVHWGLLFTCSVVNRSVGVFCRGYAGCRIGMMLSFFVQEVWCQRYVVLDMSY